MISVEAFWDELEKIAVSPAWITGKLSGMASKVKTLPAPQRASVAGRIASTEGRSQRLVTQSGLKNSSRITPAMAARPTSPKTMALQSKKDATHKKNMAYRTGRLDVDRATR